MLRAKAIANEGAKTFKNAISALFSRATPFSDVVSADSILQVPIESIAFIILRSMKTVRPDTILHSNMIISRWAGSYPKPIRSHAQRRLTEAWHRLNQQGLIAPAKVMSVYETWFVTELGDAAIARGNTLAPVELLPRSLLVDQIADAAYERFTAGRYDDACAAAFKQLEVTVRELARLPADRTGIDLMREAFKPGAGPLTLDGSCGGVRGHRRKKLE